MKFVRRVFAWVPTFIKRDAAHVAVVFGVAFAAAAAPLVPSVIHSPGLATAKAAVVAGVAASLKAGVRAARPLAFAMILKIAYKIVSTQAPDTPPVVTRAVIVPVPVSGPVVPVVSETAPSA